MSGRSRETDGPVADAVRGMYAAYGDRAGFDAHLHPDITIWETDQPDGMIGLPELDALRDRRADLPQPAPAATLSVHQLLVDRWGDTAAVARYLLRAELPDGVSSFRATDVFTATDDGWQIVHHHAEQLVERTGG